MRLDPGDFADEAIDAETRASVKALEALLATQPPITDFEPSVIRAARESGESLWGPIQRLDSAQERRIAGPAGPIPLRVFLPETVRGVYLHLHGGGWTLGAPDQHDPLLDALARRAGAAVVSVGYRLAPEHPFPAGPDDCEAAALWLVEHARAEFGSGRLVIGGESAGAHLSALTLLRLRDRHGTTPFAGANLVYGCFDLGLTPSAKRWGRRNLVLSTPIIEWFCDFFVPERARRRDPEVSPLYADLAGLPPALFSVGTWDPLLDDSLFMAARWQAACGNAELALYPGGIHGFNAFPTALARAANQRCEDFAGRVLGA